MGQNYIMTSSAETGATRRVGRHSPTATEYEYSSLVVSSSHTACVILVLVYMISYV